MQVKLLRVLRAASERVGSNVSTSATCASSPPRIATSKNPSCANFLAPFYRLNVAPSRCRRLATASKISNPHRRFRVARGSRGRRGCS